MQTALPCGQQRLTLALPDHARLLASRPAPVLADSAGAVAEALAAPLGTPPLAELARGRRSACVVISDITRPVPYRLLLPPLLRTLEAAGIPREGIVVLVATGMHRPNLGEELRGIVGDEVYGRYRIENHHCRREGDARRVAEIDGAPIEINRHYLDAELKVLTGLVEPHMYAGYSGGRKSLLPGIASFRTMQFMHSFAMIAHPRVTNCVLEGNPFHEAGEGVAALWGWTHRQRGHQPGAGAGGGLRRPPHPGPPGRLRAGGTPLGPPARGAGRPGRDLGRRPSPGRDLLPGQQGPHHGQELVRRGGTIVIACGCREGLGSPEYCGMIREGLSPAEFADRCQSPGAFVIDQWCLQTTYQAVAHAGRVLVYSPNLAARDLAALGMSKIEELQATVDGLLPGHPRVVVVPEGPYVVGLVEGGN